MDKLVFLVLALLVSIGASSPTNGRQKRWDDDDDDDDYDDHNEKNTFLPPTPSQMNYPSYVMNAPFSYHTDEPNNIWMEDMTDEERKADRKEGMEAFLRVYHGLTPESLVYVLPTPKNSTLQDLIYVANIGIVLSHINDTVIVANFTSEPRRGETPLGVKFFQSFGYNVYVSPHKFEGEADLKHLYGNVYVGGYGLRTELETFKWMERMFNMTIIPLHMVDPYLYHLDCSVFPLTRQKTMVCTDLYLEEELDVLRQYTQIIDVPYGPAKNGVCNSVRVGDTILTGSSIDRMDEDDEFYVEELIKNNLMREVTQANNLKVKFINLDEFQKSGAALSCMVLHLNRVSYD